MSFKLGSTGISSIKLGTTNISAAYIGSTQVFSTATGGVSAAVYQSDLTSDVVSNEQFQAGNHIDFAGFDTNGDPVFIVVYTESGRNNIYSLLFSVELSTGTVTTGTKYTIATGSANILFPTVTTERGHANIRGDLTVSDYAVFAWRNLSNNRVAARAASYDVDAKTMTLGTTNSFSDSLEARGQTNLAFGGTSGRYILNQRGGNNNVVPLFTVLSRSGTTLSIEYSEQSIEALGGFEFADLLGFKQDRAFFSASSNNRDIVRTQFVRWNSGTIVGSEVDIQEANEGNTRSGSAMLNATDSYINIRYETQNAPTNTQVEGGIITWNTGSTVPTLTQTNQIEVNSVARGKLGAINGVVDGEAYAFNYTGTGTDMDFHKFSLSGTTLSKTYTKTITFTALPNEDPLNDNRAVKDSNDNVCAVIYGRNSTNGYPFVTVLVNPDDL